MLTRVYPSGWVRHCCLVGLRLLKVPGYKSAASGLGGLTVAERQPAPDPHGFDATRRLDGVFKSGVIDNGLGIEQNQIGMVSLPNKASVGEPESLGGESSHFVDGGLNRKSFYIGISAPRLFWYLSIRHNL